MNEEIMNNEVVEEAAVGAVETVVSKPVSALKIAGMVAGITAVGYGIYRGVKWIASKIKGHKAETTAIEPAHAEDNVAGDESSEVTE